MSRRMIVVLVGVLGATWSRGTDAQRASEPAPAAATNDDGAVGSSDDGSSDDATGESTTGETEPATDASDVTAATTDAATDASSESAAMPSADSAPSRAPRVATVLVGDPDPARRARAAELDARLERLGLRRLGDPAMRAALLGDARENDGLERLHAARRSLLFEDDPTATLRDLGARLQVDALVVVRASDPLRVAVFDLAAGAFYEDEPTLDDLEAAATFVRRAARAAARRATAPTPADVVASSPPATEPPDVAATPDTRRPARRWLRSNWAYLVGGALLVGVVTGFVVRGRRRDDEPPPILRFRPGLE
jgi:hypothetical protein